MHDNGDINQLESDNMDRTIIIQGHDRHGWDTETVGSMDEIHAYLRHAHTGQISVYVDKIEYILPSGIGTRYV